MESTRDRNALIGILLMVAAMQIVPVNDALAKLLSQTLPVLVVVCLRTFSQSVFLVLIGLAKKGGRLPSRRSIVGKRHVLRGFLWWISTFLFFISIKEHDIPGALALFFTGPVFVAASAPLLLRERFDPRFLIASIAGFVGAVSILSPDLESLEIGLLPALVAGVCYGSYLMATRHAALDKELAAGEIAFGAGFWASIFGLPAALWLWEPVSLYIFGVVIAMGICSAFGHVLIALACQRTSASNLSPFNYTEMFGAIIASYLIFGTFPDGETWLGITLIVVAGVWAAIVSRQKAVDAIV